MTETQAIRAASRGDPDAVAHLYELYQPGIFRFLYYRTGSKLFAEDLTSEVFLRMVRSMSGFQPGRGTFAAWLYQIARRVLYDWYRSNAAHPLVELAETHPDPAPQPEEAASKNLDHAVLAEAIQSLSAEQQDVVILRFINGLSLEMTAEAIHRSIDAVKGLQSRGLQKLREVLMERGV
ncbi:MAG: sigma-70 family RNA polymerase sigma factor [Anaerolineaceae bacterium]|nr:sigma-70 family RNA polymerase sigma factor [Anaerolineaceae bacterium]